MDILYRLDRATVNEVLAQLPDSPSYSTVRAQLRVMEEKGVLRHEEEGLRYVYMPVVPREKVRTTALQHLVDTFFEGSAENVVSTLLAGERLDDKELSRLEEMIHKARRERRESDDPVG